MKINFLEYKRNEFSQNGEDGIIEKIFDLIGIESNTCCEFGAWDGIHLCNVRNLIQKGWKAIMIEGDSEKFKKLTENYKHNEKVFCVNKYVDSAENNLSKILYSLDIEGEIDFLSIDIDGLDYEIFNTLDIRPRVICIEVNAGHNPENEIMIEKSIAKNNVGQSLKSFTNIADDKDYKLVCYTGNAFYIRTDIMKQVNLEPISDKEAYKNFLDELSPEAKEWLYKVNIGIVDPFYKFNNPLLTKENLKISSSRAKLLIAKSVPNFLLHKFKEPSTRT